MDDDWGYPHDLGNLHLSIYGRRLMADHAMLLDVGQRLAKTSGR